MRESKHTPGPGRRLTAALVHEEVVIDQDNVPAFVHVIVTHVPPEYQAAPDLLKAAQRAFKLVSSWTDDGATGLEERHSSGLLMDLSAAIAKATEGGS